MKKCDATDTPTPVNSDATDTCLGQKSVTTATPAPKSYPQASSLLAVAPLPASPFALAAFIAR